MRRHFIEVDGRPVHLMDFGGSGRLVLLVHGLDGSAANWLDVGPALAAHGRIVAVDLPGFGRTPLAGHAPRMRAFGHLTRSVIHQLSGPAIVVGNSMGAVVALHAASDGAVASTVLVAPAIPRAGRLPFDFSMIPWVLPYAVPGLMRLEPLRRARKEPEQRVRWLLDLCYARGAGNRESEAAFEEMVDVARHRQLRDHVPAWVGASRSLFWGLSNRRWWHRMADHAVGPVHVIAGAADPVLPRRSVPALLERHPSWTSVMLDRVGHVPQLEAPARFLDAMGPVLEASIAA